MKKLLLSCAATLLLSAAPAVAGDVVESEGLALGAISGGDWSKAEAELRAGLQADPNDAMKLLNLAYVLKKTGRAEETANLYARVLVLNENPLVAVGSSSDAVRPERAKLLAKKAMASLK